MTKRIRLRASLAALLFPAAFASAAALPGKAEDIRPILIGSEIPAAVVKNVDGKNLSLREHLKGKKTVLIFYRGGWCPFCNKQLSALGDIHSELKALGYEIVAISADQPSVLKKAMTKKDPGYELLSDSDSNASKAFGLAFQVDSVNMLKFKAFGIDLEAASGNESHILPVPAVFLVNKNATIDFSYVNPDYKVRLKSEIIKAAAKAFSE